MTLSVGAELFRSLAVRIIIRRWTRQRLKTLALLLVVALGVSVFLSIGLTNPQGLPDILCGQFLWLLYGDCRRTEPIFGEVDNWIA